MTVSARKKINLSATLAAAAILASACTPPAEKAADYVTDARLLYEASDLVSAKLELKNAIQIEPKNAEARYLLALIHEQEEDYEKVVGNLQIAIEADPGYIDARILLGNYYSYGRLAEETKQQADAAMALAPDRDDVRLLNARAIYLAGDRAGALEETNAALSLNPGRRATISFAAALHAEAGDIDAALAVIDQGLAEVSGDDIEALRRARLAIVRLEGTPESVETELLALAREFPDTPAYNLELVRLYVANGRQDEAEQVVRALIANDPDNAQWRIQLASLLASLDKSGDAEKSLKTAVDENPESTVLQLALGGFYESAGRIDDARQIYSKVAENEPRSDAGLAARNRIVATYIGTDDDKARSLITEILRDAPDNIDALLSRAAYSFQRGQYNEAIADLQLALAKQPDSQRAMLLLARSYLGDGNTALAENTYRKLVTINPANRAATNELAVVLGNRGGTEEAEALLRQSLERAPGDSGASRNLVKALLLQEDFAGAESEARRIIDLGEASGVAEFQLGQALEAQQEPERAMTAYKKSLQKNPTADQPLNGLIRLLVQSGKANEAEAYLENHVASNPDHLAAQLLLGDTYRSRGNTDKSRKLFDDIIANRPDVAAAYVGLAALHGDASDERVAVLRQGLERNPGDARLALALGSTHKKRGEYERAIAVYEGLMQRDQNNDFIANNLASLLLDYRTDKQSFERALQVASRFNKGNSHPINLGVLGWAHYRNGQYPQAVRYLEQSVAGAGQNPVLRYYLGMAYLKSNNPAGAKQELQIAVDTANAAGATFTGFEEAQAALGSLQAAS